MPTTHTLRKEPIHRCPPPQNVLEIKDLHVRVAQTDENAEPINILKGVNLTVRSGETHAIMGPNGSGKSTLSYAIAGHPQVRGDLRQHHPQR